MENPFIIMLINMTIVFAVLFGLSLLINLIHLLDPTRKKEEPKAASEPVQAAPAAPVAAPEAPAAPAAEEGVSQEVIAVIAAAISASCGYQVVVRAVHPIDRCGWKASGRMMKR